MFRRQMMAIMIASLTLFPLTSYADARVTTASALVDKMISDLEQFLDAEFEKGKSYKADRADWLDGAF